MADCREYKASRKIFEQIRNGATTTTIADIAHSPQVGDRVAFRPDPNQCPEGYDTTGRVEVTVTGVRVLWASVYEVQLENDAEEG